jgi:hypothetical protein
LLFILSQALSDLDTQHGLPLLTNHGVVVLLKQRSAREIQFNREALGLAEQQAAIVGNLQIVPGRFAEVFWRNGERGMGRSRFVVGPTEYWAFTNEPFRDVPAREAMIAKHNDDVWAAVCQLASEGVPTGTQE